MNVQYIVQTLTERVGFFSCTYCIACHSLESAIAEDKRQKESIVGDPDSWTRITVEYEDDIAF